MNRDDIIEAIGLFCILALSIGMIIVVAISDDPKDGDAYVQMLTAGEPRR